jgi:hypothetical protein
VPSPETRNQVLGAIAQFEKASPVAKLKAARDRKRARDGKREGGKSHGEVRSLHRSTRESHRAFDGGRVCRFQAPAEAANP